MRFTITSLALLLSLRAFCAGEMYLTPSLETQAGFEQNRWTESGSGQGSAFWLASPGLEFLRFGEKTEAALGAEYRVTSYFEEGFEYREEPSGYGRWRYFDGPYEAGLTAGGGQYRDRALPDDDCTYWYARPYATRTLARAPAEWTLGGTVRQTFYDTSVYTSATDRADLRVELRPGLRWHLSNRATLWAEGYAEWNTSDAPEAEYSGFGAAAGGLCQLSARWTAGAWAETGTRIYDVEVDGTEWRDTPLRAGMWTTCRLRPWLELLASVDGESFSSTVDGNDYSWWRAAAGVRLVFEHEAGAR